LPRKCVKWSPTTNNALLQQLNVMENPCHRSQGSLLLPSQWIQISVWKFHFNYWHLSLPLSKEIQILHKILRHSPLTWWQSISI
jgi:hypothetical protein